MALATGRGAPVGIARSATAVTQRRAAEANRSAAIRHRDPVDHGVRTPLWDDAMAGHAPADVVRSVGRGTGGERDSRYRAITTGAALGLRPLRDAGGTARITGQGDARARAARRRVHSFRSPGRGQGIGERRRPVRGLPSVAAAPRAGADGSACGPPAIRGNHRPGPEARVRRSESLLAETAFIRDNTVPAVAHRVVASPVSQGRMSLGPAPRPGFGQFYRFTRQIR